MEAPQKMSRHEFINHMREKMEAMLGQVADAVNDAPPGETKIGQALSLDGMRMIREQSGSLRQDGPVT